MIHGSYIEVYNKATCRALYKQYVYIQPLEIMIH